MARRQADIARAVGISPAYLNLIEHNRRPVGADLIARLAEVLEVPPTSWPKAARRSASRPCARPRPIPWPWAPCQNWTRSPNSWPAFRAGRAF
ncbi:helix-turn-helix domain-containing protein [Paracoccus sp. NBH48]|uniref:helix-turn-helix domain-containing protein n=1 Tax=Paracoccus sp. NBH48 TaxID=2596918 RepID=UPI00351C42E4